jgi:uncharacterized membrane protein YvlD (DUF360 family)
MNSPFLNLNTKDFLKGLFIAVVTAVITILYTSIQNNVFTFDWKNIGMVALSAALAYIMKNLLTNSKNELLKQEPKVNETI